MIDTLYNFAKFQYECGNYSGAAEYLYFVRVLVSSLYIVQQDQYKQNTLTIFFLLWNRLLTSYQCFKFLSIIRQIKI